MINVYDPPDVEALAFSDLHLGRSDAYMVLAWAEVWIPRVRRQIIALGDIIDLQVAGTVDAFQAGSQFAWQIMATKQRMCPITYLSGNHDSRMSEILGSAGDVTILDGHDIHQLRPNLYCTHGDRYDWADAYLYQPLDRINFLGGPIVAAAMRKIDRRTGRSNNAGIRKRVMSDVHKLSAGSIFIHGHTHTPYDYGTDDRGRRAIDLGSALSPRNEIQFAAQVFGNWTQFTWGKRHAGVV